jgi:hypothetical protein
MKKTNYTKPVVEKAERLVFPCVDEGDDIEARYTCSGTGWNSGTSRGCLDGMDEGKKGKKLTKDVS